MTTTTLVGPLGTQWSADNRITITEDTEVAIGNPSFTYTGRFVVTESTDLPSFSVAQAPHVPPRGRDGMSLHAGDYLWLAADDNRLSLTVMMQASA